MKKLLFFLFVIVNVNVYSQTITLDGLRKEYQQIFKDSAICYKIYKKVVQSTNTDLIFIAYKGAVTAAMANHSKDRKEKINLFNAGKKLLEQSIAADSLNVETRFLRFTVQTNCPKALNYYKHIKSDKEFMLKNYSEVSNLLVKRMISSFSQQSSALSATEKQKLK